MALPFLLGLTIIVIAGLCFLFGLSKHSFQQKGAFIAFAGLLILLTGAFMMSEGLELPYVKTITESADGLTNTITYKELVNTEGTAQWMLFNAVFWLGAVLLLLSIVYTVSSYKDAKVQSRRDVLDF